jgi:O-antigen ligase
VPLVDRFLVPPPAWPPAQDAREVDEVLDYCTRRDPLGDAIHALLACLYVACAGLATSLETVAFFLLVGYAALRGPNLWRAWVPLVAVPFVWAVLLFAAWAVVSLAWTSDVDAGRDALAGLRALLVLPALAPLAHRRRLILAALLAGLALQVVLQFAQAGGLLEPHPRNPIRHAGLSSHPGQLSSYYAAAFLIGLAWLCSVRTTRTVIVLVGALALFIAGMLIAAGRGALVSLVVALPILAVLLAPSMRPSRRLAAIGLALAATIGLVGALALRVADQAGLARGAHDLARAADVGSSAGSRFVFWEAALETWRAHPWIGTGIGGTRDAFLENDGIRAAAAQRPDLGFEYFAHQHPHSTYLQVLSELGLVGAALFALVLWTAAKATLRSLSLARSSGDLVVAGVAAALAAWSIAAAFDAFLTAGRTLALAMILLSFLLLPVHRPDRGEVA